VTDAFFEKQASTRVVGAMRILAVLVTWSRFGAGMVPAFASGPAEVALGVGFWTVSALAFLGLWSRLTIGLTGLACMAIYYGQGLIGGNGALSSHHVYAQALLCCLLALTPCGRSFSLDRWRLGLPERGPVWGQTLIAVQVTVLYLGAVYEKSYLAWFDGSRLQQIGMSVALGSTLPEGWAGVAFEAATILAAWLTWVVELALAVLIWVPRWRLRVLVVGFVFHALVYAFTPVATFSVTMYVFLLAALDPDAVHDAMERTERLGTPVVAGRPWGWVAIPVALLPLLVGGRFGVPRVEAFEELGLQTCALEVVTSDGSRFAVPVRDQGIDGAKRFAAQECRGRGPVRIEGRCGGPTGWEDVSIGPWCQAPPPRTSNRRVSAR
jgi:hypothetical protein